MILHRPECDVILYRRQRLPRQRPTTKLPRQCPLLAGLFAPPVGATSNTSYLKWKTRLVRAIKSFPNLMTVHNLPPVGLGPVAYYHFFFLDLEGDVAHRGGAYFASDEQALTRARKLHSIGGIEVWQAARLVGRAEPLIDRKN